MRSWLVAAALFVGVHAALACVLHPPEDALGPTLVDLALGAVILGMLGIRALFAANDREQDAVRTITDLERSAGLVTELVGSIARALAERVRDLESERAAAVAAHTLRGAVKEASDSRAFARLPASRHAEGAKRLLLQEAERSFRRARAAERYATTPGAETYRSSSAAAAMDCVAQEVFLDVARRLKRRIWSAVAGEAALYLLTGVGSLCTLVLLVLALFTWIFTMSPLQ